MKASIQDRLRNAKQRIKRRLERPAGNGGRPMFAGTNVRYELADKVRGITAGGIGLVQSVALELAEFGVRCNAICPGTIDTPMLAASADGWEAPLEELYAEIAQKIPVRRLGTPEDVAKVAAFLLSEDAGYIAGSSVFLEGGTMGLPPW